MTDPREGEKLAAARDATDPADGPETVAVPEPPSPVDDPAEPDPAEPNVADHEAAGRGAATSTSAESHVADSGPADPDPAGSDPADPGPANSDPAGSDPVESDGADSDAAGSEVVGPAAAEPGTDAGREPKRKASAAGSLIGVLLALLGFTLVVQLRSNNVDEGLTAASQDELVSILSNLEARDSRLQSQIAALESSQRQLTSGVSNRQAALAEAARRAEELGLLAGTVPARGPGLRIEMDKVRASAVLNTVQELRGSGGEVMELAGSDGAVIRIVASSYFVDAEGGGILVDGTRIMAPYTLWVIGSPQTMQPALQIQGGVVASVNSNGGSVRIEPQDTVQVTAVRKATALQYARPVS